MQVLKFHTAEVDRGRGPTLVELKRWNVDELGRMKGECELAKNSFKCAYGRERTDENYCRMNL